MRFLGRLFPSFDGPRYTSPYFYIQPKKRWWPFLTGCALGGVVVLVLIGKFGQSADSSSYSVNAYNARSTQTHTQSKKLARPTAESADAQSGKSSVEVVPMAEAASDPPTSAKPEAADAPIRPDTPAATASNEPVESATQAQHTDAAHADMRRDRVRHVHQRKFTKALARKYRRDRHQPALPPEEETFAMTPPRPSALFGRPALPAGPQQFVDGQGFGAGNWHELWSFGH